MTRSATLVWIIGGLAALVEPGPAASKARPKPTLAIAAAHLVWHDPTARDRIDLVLVEELARRPVAGTYWLLDTGGRIATLELTATRDHDGGCPFHAELHVVGDVDHLPGEYDHEVVIGPLDDAAQERWAKARLLFLGLARAGHAGDDPAEPLGVRGPKGAAPTYAVDLDGDGVGDLAMDRTVRDGKVRRGTFDVTTRVQTWRRSGKRWKRLSRCRWTKRDVID